MTIFKCAGACSMHCFVFIIIKILLIFNILNEKVTVTGCTFRIYRLHMYMSHAGVHFVNVNVST